MQKNKSIKWSKLLKYYLLYRISIGKTRKKYKHKYKKLNNSIVTSSIVQEYFDIEDNKKAIKDERYIQALWNLKGVNDNLFSLLDYLHSTSENITPKTLLIYAQALLETGQTDFAKEALLEYFKLYGTTHLHEFLPLSSFARKIGIHNELTEKAADLFELMEKNQHFFSNYLKDKTIAIVGNAPTELQTNNGTKIDSHDIVIRMNAFSTEINFKKDYGNKTNIYVHTANYTTLYQKNHDLCDTFNWIFIPYDFWHINLQQFTNPTDFLNKMSILKNHNITYLKSKYSIELKEKLKLTSPSCGIITLWTIYKEQKKLCQSQIFGFSKNIQNSKNEVEHYFKDTAFQGLYDTENASSYYKTPIYQIGHSFIKEAEFRKTFVSDN